MIKLYRGNTFSRPIIVSGYTLQMGDKIEVGVKRFFGQSVFLLQDTIVVTESGHSSVWFVFPAATTAGLDCGTYIFEVRLVPASGSPIVTIVQEQLKVEESIYE